MGIRVYFLFLFFFASCAAAETVPTVHVKAPAYAEGSYTSGPNTVINQQQITRTGITSLAQILQSLGGVQLQDMAGNGSQVSLGMRGFGMNASSNTLLLINGIPVTNPDMAPPDLNAIPVQEIESIEIISGSESVLYGDQAVGGIINIHTRQYQENIIEASCNGGSYNLYGCRAAIRQHIYMTNFNMSAATSHTDNYRDHNDYDQNLVMGDVMYPYANGRINFNYKIANEDMQYPGALTTAQVRQDREQASNDIDYFKDWNAFLHLHHQQQFSSDWQFETDLAHRVMHGHGVLYSPFTQSRSTYFLKPQIKGIFKRSIITSGLDVQDDRYNLNSSFGPTDNHQQQYGLFGISNIPLDSHFSVSIGARGAQQGSYLRSSTVSNTINRAAATTLGGNYKPNNNLEFYLRRAGSFRFPKADENTFAANGVGSLRTQRGISYESGVQAKNKNNTAKLAIYQLNLRDEIAFDPLQTPQQPFGSNRNLSPTVRRGLILSGKHRLTRQLSIDGQYNYVHARFQNGVNSGNLIPLVSENILHAGLNYHFAQHWNFYTEALFTGSQYAANDDANIAGRLGGYTVYNFNLRYHWKNFTASFRVNNIFNKYYYFYTVYQPSMPSEFFYPAPTRNFVLTASYAFE